MIPNTVAFSSDVKQRSLRAPDQHPLSKESWVMWSFFCFLRNNYINLHKITAFRLDAIVGIFKAHIAETVRLTTHQ